MTVLVGVSLYLVWNKIFPSELDRIHAQLGKLESVVQWSSDQHILSRASNSQGLGEIFATDIEIQFQHAAGNFELRSLPTLQENFLQAQLRVPELSLSLQDVETEVSEDEMTAQSRFTAVITGRSASQQDEFLEASEFEIHWQKKEGQWMIQKLKNIEALQFQ